MSEDEAHFWCHDMHERLSDWYRHGCPDDEAAAIKRHVTAQIRREVVEQLIGLKRACLYPDDLRNWLAKQEASDGE